MLDTETEMKIANRLRRAEGQVAGVRRMVEEGKYCVDILIQLSAAQSALAQAGKVVLANHMATCVKDTFKSGDEVEREQKIAELMDVFVRYAGPGLR
jgi:DNA-binding FrmR family transcriptional regulator